MPSPTSHQYWLQAAIARPGSAMLKSPALTTDIRWTMPQANGLSKARKPREQSGFTMVELLAVAIVLGLLAALTIPHFVRARSVDLREMCISNLRQIDSAKEQWAVDFKQLPSATPTFHNIRFFLKLQGDNGVPVCPLDASNAFETSYLVNTLTSAPVCLLNRSRHALE